MSLSRSTIAIVNATASVVAQNAEAITNNFYPRMLKNNPEVLEFFNMTNQVSGRQPRSLAQAVIAYATHIERLGELKDDVERIAHKHCSLNVKAEHYPIVHDNLMASIAEVLGDAVTPEIGAAWSEAVNFLGTVLIKREAELYSATAAQNGGWSGKRQFRVAQRVQEADQVASFVLEPTDGGPVCSHLPGQYVSVCTNPLLSNGERQPLFAPRQYSLTNAPEDPRLRITVKHLTDPETDRFGPGQHHPDGVMSSWLVGRQEGDTLDLLPPFGEELLSQDDSKNVVLISSGIGVTPHVNLLREALSKRAKVAVIHQDQSASAHPMRQQMADLASAQGKSVPTLYCYSDEASPAPQPGAQVESGRVSAARVEQFLVDNGFDLQSTEIYISANVPISEMLTQHFIRAKQMPAASVKCHFFGPTVKLA